MKRRETLSAAVLIGIVIFDILVYQHNKRDFSKGNIPICYPSEKVKLDSVANSISEIMASGRNVNSIQPLR